MHKWFLLLLAIGLVGCAGLGSRIVGTWKVRGVDASTSQSTLEQLGSKLASSLLTGATFEFSDQGRVKLTHAIATQEGTYRIEGDTVLVMLGGDDKPTFRLKLAGNDTLESVREFNSDPKIVLERQQ